MPRAVYVAWDARGWCRYIGSVNRRQATAVGDRLAEHHQHPRHGPARRRDWVLLTVLPIRADAPHGAVLAAEGWAARLLVSLDGGAHPVIDLMLPPDAIAARSPPRTAPEPGTGRGRVGGRDYDHPPVGSPVSRPTARRSGVRHRPGARRPAVPRCSARRMPSRAQRQGCCGRTAARRPPGSAGTATSATTRRGTPLFARTTGEVAPAARSSWSHRALTANQAFLQGGCVLIRVRSGRSRWGRSRSRPGRSRRSRGRR